MQGIQSDAPAAIRQPMYDITAPQRVGPITSLHLPGGRDVRADVPNQRPQLHDWLER